MPKKKKKTEYQRINLSFSMDNPRDMMVFSILKKMATDGKATKYIVDLVVENTLGNNNGAKQTLPQSDDNRSIDVPHISKETVPQSVTNSSSAFLTKKPEQQSHSVYNKKKENLASKATPFNTEEKRGLEEDTVDMGAIEGILDFYGD